MNMPSIIPAALVLAVGTAAAQDFPGDANAGQDFAQRACMSCHAERLEEFGLPARSFEEIANTPGITATALIAWLTSIPHPTMPNLILAPDEARDVVAYILSLRHPGGGTHTLLLPRAAATPKE